MKIESKNRKQLTFKSNINKLIVCDIDVKGDEDVAFIVESENHKNKQFPVYLNQDDIKTLIKHLQDQVIEQPKK